MARYERLADVEHDGQGGADGLQAGLQAELFGQLDDAPDWRITVFRRFRFVAAQHVSLVDNAEIVSGHQVVARARRDVQDFVQAARQAS